MLQQISRGDFLTICRKTIRNYYSSHRKLTVTYTFQHCALSGGGLAAAQKHFSLLTVQYIVQIYVS